jgi:hypothetical protein
MACEIYINDNKELFEYLKTKKDIIQKDVGSELEWREAGQASRIIQRNAGFHIGTEAERDKYYIWFIERASFFSNVFGPIIKKYKSEE